MKLNIITFVLFLLTSIGVKAENPGWTVNAYAFHYSMTVTGVLIIDHIESADTSDVIAAFVGSECRGVTKPIYNSAIGRYIAFLMIYSNTPNGENVSFKIYHSGENIVVNATQIVSFFHNNSIGMITDPYLWSNTVLGRDANILSYSFPQQILPAVIDTSARTIQVTVAQGTNVSALTASFTLAPYDSVRVSNVIQQSGITVNDFTAPVVYTVTAENPAYIKNWTVTVNYCESRSTATVGGTQDHCATLTSTGLGGNTPLVGIGEWSIVNGGSGTFSNAATGNSNFTGDAIGTYVLRWTISNGPCTPSTADITVNYYQAPSTASVGASQNLCGTLISGALGGNTPSVGSGVWSIVSGGTGTFSDATDGGSIFTADNAGTYVLRWTISNRTCNPSTADVIVNYYESIAANAGFDQNLCNKDLTLLIGNTPSSGSGSWSFVSGPNTPALSPVPGSMAIATDIIAGVTPYIFRYTITNGNCITTDDMTVTDFNQPETAFAGNDQVICSSLPATATMTADNPVYGVGKWTKESGTNATITTPTDSATSITELSAGIFVFRWTVTNGTCQASSSLVTLSVRDSINVNAGSDISICDVSTATMSASASGYNSLLWTSSGTGTFNSNSILNPVYTPSTSDILYGSAILTLTASQGSICPPVSDHLTLTINRQAVVNAGSDTTICESGTYTLSTANASNATNLLWTTSGDGSFSSATSLNPVYSPGTSDISLGSASLTLTDWPVNSCVSTDNMVLSINKQSTANAGNYSTICEGSTYELSSASANNATSVLWTSTGTGTFSDTTLLNPVYTPSASDILDGFIALKLHVSSAPSCSTSTNAMLLNINPTGQVNDPSNQNICNGEPTALISFSSVNTGGITSYTWTNNQTSIGIADSGTGDIASFIAVNTGSVPVVATLEVTPHFSNGGVTCDGPAQSFTITVRPTPTAAAGGSSEICFNSSATVSGASASNGNILWTGNGHGSITGESTLTPTYNAVLADAGTTVTLTLTVTSTNSCSYKTATYLINVIPLPTISCGGNRQKNTDPGLCAYTVQGSEFNPVTYNVSCSTWSIINNYTRTNTLAGASFPKGTTMVTWTVTDEAANSSTCSFKLQVTDSELPAITCVGNQTKNSDAGVCTYTVHGTGFNPVIFSDNCSGSTISNNYTNTNTLNHAMFPTGTTTVIWTVKDASGNKRICSFNITVIDNQLPSITCGANKTKNADVGACTYKVQGAEFNPAFTDNCNGSSINNNFTHTNSLAGAIFPKGTTNVIWTVRDASNNVNTCSYNVIITDNEKPLISSCPSNITLSNDAGHCDAVVTWTEPTATDNCTPSGNLVWSKSHTPGSTFPAGTTTVTYTATDASNNSSLACSFNIIVIDNEKPVISGCPSDITQSNIAGRCDAVVTWTNPTATDNCTLSGSLIWNKSHNPGSIFAVGTTTVVYSVSDAAGNTSLACSFNVTVNDNEKPLISNCPSDITLTLDAGQCNTVVAWTEPAATDNCTSSGNLIWSRTHTPGSQFSAGTTTVTYRATDASGNTSQVCSFTVSVIDTEIPAITCVSNQQKSTDIGAITYTVQGTEFNPVSFNDNCSPSISNNYTHTNTLDGAIFRGGTTTVIWTVSDLSANTSTCSFEVRVINMELKVKVILQTAYNTTTGLMSKKLDSLNLIPADQPYNVLPWRYTGEEKLRAGIGRPEIVDWVLVELREANTTTVADRRAGLLMRNGEIRDTNLTTGLNFSHIAQNSSYYITILHRNHLSVMSGSMVTIPNATSFNFYDTLLFRPYGGGKKAMIELEGAGAGKFAMIAGDINNDGIIKYSGANNDRAAILLKLIQLNGGINNINVSISNVYRNEDLTMNGVLRYLGNGNDPRIILQSLTKMNNNSIITGIYRSLVPNAVIYNNKRFNDGTLDLIATEDINNYYISLQTKQTIDNGLIDNIQFTVSWAANDIRTERLISGYSSAFKLMSQGNAYTIDGKKYQVFATIDPIYLPEQFEAGQSIVIMKIPKNGISTMLSKNIDLEDDANVQSMEGEYYVSVWGEDMTGGINGNTTFISENHNDNLILSYYPNPSLNGKFTVNVSSSSDQDISLKVYDVVGICVYECQLNVNSNTPILKEVNLENLSKGTYLIDVSNSKLKYSGKIIIF